MIVTREMQFLLNYCQFYNPLEKLILTTCKNLSKDIGDHTMTSMILLTSIYNSLMKYISVYKLNQYSMIRNLNGIIFAVNEMKGNLNASLLSELNTEHYNRYRNAIVGNKAHLEKWYKSICNHIILPATNHGISLALCDIMVRVYICTCIYVHVMILTYVDV